jgi:hypothetical protein
MAEADPGDDAVRQPHWTPHRITDQAGRRSRESRMVMFSRTVRAAARG